MLADGPEEDGQSVKCYLIENLTSEWQLTNNVPHFIIFIMDGRYGAVPMFCVPGSVAQKVAPPRRPSFQQ